MGTLTRRALLATLAGAAAWPATANAFQHGDHGGSTERADIPGFDKYDYKADGHTRKVYVQGWGAPVLVLHELPGMSWQSILFAQRLTDRGFRVHMPLLFGGVGQNNGFSGYLQSCFGSQFDCSNPDGVSRILEWIRALTRDIASKEGRPMAAIGMCLTGSFPLALMDIQEVVAGVLSQPALPLGDDTEKERRGLGLSTAETNRAHDRAEARFLALRFSNDELCTADRFETLTDLLGDRLECVVIPSGPNTAFSNEAHAVLSGWYRSEPDSGTKQAFERVVTFLRTTLGQS